MLIDKALLNQLKVYHAWCKEVLFSFGFGFSDSNYIFISHKTRKPIAHSTTKYSIDRIVQKTKCKKITAHGLRHTHGTILLSQRIPIKVVADRLGNTPQMILDIYGHTFKDLEEESVQA
ncbi:tyrosine-type recombinase/integrase [Bacillus sp. WMMC1349]|uniref:tyrosine-type recombinase/integrase n=1 Tax=Bacillus sp. WMMC1349 TaxID=2736254 RepID=UPI0028162056|nr:tyrosine-type recombinase/integrase [Bacillus sp. WMMC1349]